MGQDMFKDLIIRNDFSRDRDRIKFSRAFRRLQHKAQIYSHEKGDHYRTRLTHTLEVSQIARSIARNLNLNEDLVEAISLGHDIGHTPFGHQGERVLDEIMCGEEDIGGKIKYKINYGGFKHNYHSIKILDVLEVKYKDFKGMNLTWQVLEGILKHTKIKRHIDCKRDDNENKCKGCWDIHKFINPKRQDDNLVEYMKYPFSITLEGQIVAIADEIAQRQHDIDDGLRDIELKLSIEELLEDLLIELEKIEGKYNDKDCLYIENLKDLIKTVEKIKKQVEEEKKNKTTKDSYSKDLYIKNTLIRNVIDFFIKDVTLSTLKKMYDAICISKVCICEEDEQGNKIFKEDVVKFSCIGEKVNDIIESYVKNKILNSYNVNRFDGKSNFIIKQLFKAYYSNPRQMPTYILDRLTEKIKYIYDNIYEIKINLEDSEKDINEIDFTKNKPSEIKALISVLKLDDEGIKKIIPKLDSDFNETILNIIANKEIKQCSEKELPIKALTELHYAYLSVICDYIAGMTDNYASNEYKKLYMVE
nr:dNTP triphosphohydrolase [Caloramator proteoclasticus]